MAALWGLACASDRVQRRRSDKVGGRRLGASAPPPELVNHLGYTCIYGDGQHYCWKALKPQVAKRVALGGGSAALHKHV